MKIFRALKPKNKKAFTLIEILIVIAIIAILLSITVIGYSGVQKKSRDNTRKSDLSSIASALTMYYQEKRALPPYDYKIETVLDATGYDGSNRGVLVQFLTILTSYLPKIPCDPKLDSEQCRGGEAIIDNMRYSYIYYPKDVWRTQAAAAAAAAGAPGCTVTTLEPVTGAGSHFSLFTHLESPSGTDKATIARGCNWDYGMQQYFKNNFAGSYDLNYRVGN